MTIADRIAQIDSKLWQQAFQRAQNNPQAVDLSIGFPEENTPEPVKQAGIRAIERNITRYTSSQGTEQLRAAIAAKLLRDNAIKIAPNQIAATPGLATGHLSVFMSLLNPG